MNFLYKLERDVIFLQLKNYTIENYVFRNIYSIFIDLLSIIFLKYNARNIVPYFDRAS